MNDLGSEKSGWPTERPSKWLTLLDCESGEIVLKLRPISMPMKLPLSRGIVA